MTLTATERDLVDAASRWFDAHRAQFVDELCELLRYPSVSDESDPNPRPGAPYGPEVRRVFGSARVFAHFGLRPSPWR